MAQKRISLAERQRLAAEALEAQADEKPAVDEASTTTEPEAPAEQDAAAGDRSDFTERMARRVVERWNGMSPEEQAESPHLHPDQRRRPKEPAAETPKKRRKSAADYARESGKVALGIYFPDVDDLEEARRAFVTDFWEHDGPDTFNEWVSQAVLAHAARTSSERAKLAQPRRDRRTGVKGKMRKLDVRKEVSDALQKAVSEDLRTQRRQISISAWGSDAIAAAVAETKNRTEGDLMVIEGVLPARLRK